MTIFILLLLLILLIFITLYLNVVLDYGFLFKPLIRHKLVEYDMEQKELNNTHTLPNNIQELTNARYNLYYPKDTTSVLPVVISIHGGGLISGNKEFNRYMCAEIAKHGFLVCVPAYPLVPSVHVREQLKTLTETINLIASECSAYHGNQNSLFLLGDSAGAWLTLYLTAISKNEKVARAFDLTPIKPEIKALGFICGMFYTTQKDSIGIVMRRHFFGNNYRQKNFYPYLNPEVLADTTPLPPSILFSSSEDFLKQNTLRFGRKLSTLSPNHELFMFKEASLLHDFPAYHPETDSAQELFDKLTHFFYNHQ